MSVESLERNMNWILATSLSVSVISFLFYYSNLLMLILYIIVTICVTTTIAIFGFYVYVSLTAPKRQSLLTSEYEQQVESIHNIIMRSHEETPLVLEHLPVIFGRTVDGLMQQLMDYILRDFLIVYLKSIGLETDNLMISLREDFWSGLMHLHRRVSKIDASKLIAMDVVTKVTVHFEKIRIAQSRVADSSCAPVLSVLLHLKDKQHEMDYLRKVANMCIRYLLPKEYYRTPLKLLLREVLAMKAISIVTCPDYINRRIIDYLESQQQAKALRQKTFDYAANFEEFLKMINNCADIDELKGFRYHIMSEIMEATAMQNQQRSKGVDPDLDKTNLTMSKADMNAAKKLKQYISQLTYAKNQCERALEKLGCRADSPSDEENKMLPLSSILDTVCGRRHFCLFLETVNSSGLLGFYTAVEELRIAPRSSWHQLGVEIFYTYIRAPSAEVKVDKDVRKRMEAFLLGDRGPEVLYEVQKTVLATLEEKYYPPFLLSAQYEQLKSVLAEDDRSEGKDNNMEDTLNADCSSESFDGVVRLGDHSNYARMKLDQLQEKLNNKMQALQALKSSLKPESRVLSILEKEVEWLKSERRQLEAHLSRTEIWGENLGRWRASVQNAEMPDERSPPQFVLVVHMSEAPESGVECVEGRSCSIGSAENGDICTGWVVLRTLTQFQELHRKLRPLCSDLKNIDLPTNPFKFLFGKTDKAALDKAKHQVQKYLEFILTEEHLYQSEALYAFLSPSSEHLKRHTTASPKKSRFSFSTLLKSAGVINDSPQRIGETNTASQLLNFLPPREEEPNEMSMYLDGNDSSMAQSSSNKSNADMDGKDTIAEPLYTLMGEIFDMKGLFMWLRRSLISFVQVTYGSTINRQIRDSISYLHSEPMLHYYLSQVIKCWWPGGEFYYRRASTSGASITTSDVGDPKDDQEEDKTAIAETTDAVIVEHIRTPEMRRELAGALLAENIPQILTNLVGARTARRGVAKVFEIIQDEMANKQLFYEILELVIVELFPELQKQRRQTTSRETSATT